MRATKQDRPGKAYWELVAPFWEVVNIYEGPEIFELAFGKVPKKSGHLLAAHWCQSEVRNGGFHQFFVNPTGVLAPEAVEGFRAIGVEPWAELLERAMQFFGSPYPREQAKRAARLRGLSGATRKEWDPFYALDEDFYAWQREERGRWEKMADAYAES